MGRRALVLWSGGADSTCLIQRLLDDPRYEEVLAGYVRVSNNADKAGSELRAIEAMRPRFERSGRFAFLGVLMEVGFARTNPNLAFKQMPVWLLALVEAVHPPVDEVAIGYIRSPRAHDGTVAEDAAAHLDDLRRIYAAYRPLMHHTMPELVFPIAALTKEEVLAGLDEELRRHVVHCEYPVRDVAEGVDRYAACGACRVCRLRMDRT